MLVYMMVLWVQADLESGLRSVRKKFPSSDMGTGCNFMGKGSCMKNAEKSVRDLQ